MLIHSEIRTTVSVELECPMREERQSFRFLGNLVGQVCRENLGHRALVLGFVVEDGVRRDKYFTDRERLVV